MRYLVCTQSHRILVVQRMHAGVLGFSSIRHCLLGPSVLFTCAHPVIHSFCSCTRSLHIAYKCACVTAEGYEGRAEREGQASEEAMLLSAGQCDTHARLALIDSIVCLRQILENAAINAGIQDIEHRLPRSIMWVNPGEVKFTQYAVGELSELKSTVLKTAGEPLSLGCVVSV